MALRDQPYLPLYIQDFLTDEKLIECSAAAQGVYIRIMCLMHKSENYGKILLRQKYRQNSQQDSRQLPETCRMLADQLVKQMPFSVDVIFEALVELITEKVMYLDGDFLCQKRMIKDNELSIKRSESGKKGAEATNSKKFAGNFAAAKVSANESANTEYENEYTNSSKSTTVNDLSSISKSNFVFDKSKTIASENSENGNFEKKEEKPVAEKVTPPIPADDEKKKKVPPKKKKGNPDATPHWPELTKIYNDFVVSKGRDRPTFIPQECSAMKQILSHLQKRAEEQGAQWTPEVASQRWRTFLGAAWIVDTKWLQKNFLLANIYGRIDLIFSQIKNPKINETDTNTTKTEHVVGRDIIFD